MKNFLGKVQKKGPAGIKKDKIERVTGLSRGRRREEIAKWNQMTVLRFQTGGRHQTFPASLRGANENRGPYQKEWNEKCTHCTFLRSIYSK